MKKKFFLIGALVTISMSAMFIACSSKNTPTNGCSCVVKIDGEVVENNARFTLADMKEYYGVSTCGAFASKYQSEARAQGMNMSLSCTPY